MIRNTFMIGFFLSAFSLFASPCFEEHMGKNTSYWKNIKTEEDKALFSFYEKQFDQFINQKPSEKNSIPKILYFIWMDKHPLPKKYIDHISSWKNQHPDWKIELWTMNRKQKFPFAVNYAQNFSFQTLSFFFYHTENPIEKERLLAFELLSQRGGVIVDIRCPCLDSLEKLPLSSMDFFSSLFPPLTNTPTGSSISLSNAIIASKPNHPIIQHCMENIQNRWFQIGKAFPLDDLEAKLFRYTYRTHLSLEEAVKNCAGENDIVFPARYFHKIGNEKPLFASGYIGLPTIQEESPFREKHSKFIRRLLSQEKIFFIMETMVLLTIFFFLIGILKEKKDFIRGSEKK